jgi:uncharacterized tellurite resistance protein B-like protein
MWSAIRKLFGGGGVDVPVAGGSPLEEARVCATALLVEAALSDGIYADIESEQIRDIVRTSFGVDEAAAANILSNAEELAETAADQHRFTNIVKRLPLNEREQLVENLWRVVFADGEETPEEEAMVRKLADLLHVDPRASRLARRKAADGGALPGDGA